MIRKFVETEIFQEDLANYKISMAQLRDLQNELLANPEKGPVVTGTGGTRKVRMGKSGSGKSSGYRVMYSDFKSGRVIYFWMIFGKGDQDNLTTEQKSVLKSLNLKISNELKRR